jgi:DNA-binding XRE family transcriptional regulator
MRRKLESDAGVTLLQVIGRKIAESRDEIGLTQTELARRIHVSRFQMCKHESGGAEMPMTRFFDICSVLRVTPNDLLRAITRTLGNGSQ